MDILIVHKLCEILDGHLERYHNLVTYVEQEKKYLLELDLESLFISSQHKEEMAFDIQKNIKTLVEAINETALMLGWPLEPQPLLADLVPCLPKPYDNKVNDSSIKLERLKNTILRENEVNQRFIEEAMRMVNESISILTGVNQIKTSGYTQKGSKTEQKMIRPVKLSKEV